jgi:hypothetical protein
VNHFYERPINEIDEKMIKLYEQLEEMSEPRFTKCLTQFIHNYDFIDWLRKKTKGILSNLLKEKKFKLIVFYFSSRY